MVAIAAPAWADVRLGLATNAMKGFVCARQRDGSPLLKVSQPVDAAADARGMEVFRLAGWEYGLGGPEYTTDPATRKQIVTASASGTGSAGDTVGGGWDGSYGAGMPGPFITTVAVGSGGEVVRDLLAWTPRTGANAGVQLYYAAAGLHIYQSSSPEFTSGVSTVFGHATGVKVRKLVSFQGSNSIPRLYAFSENGAIESTADGTNWAAMNAAGGLAYYNDNPKAFLKTTDNGANYTDYTANVGGAGTAALSNLDTVTNGDWILIGSDQPFSAIEWTLTNVNGNVATSAIHYWGEGGWTAVSGFTDNTLTAGHTLGAAGPLTMTWTRPAANWVVAGLTDLGATGAGPSLTQAYFWIRVSVSAALDGSTDVDVVVLSRNLEGVAATVDGDTLRWIGADTRTIYRTKQGGPAPTDITSGIDKLGAGYAPVIGLDATADVVLAYRTTDVSAVQEDGTIKPVAPGLVRRPAESNDGQAFVGWSDRNAVYYASNAGMTQIDVLSGEKHIMGPERALAGTSGIQARVTAACPDRTQFLYAAFRDDTNSNAYLAKWGGYTLGTDADTALPSIQHIDAWHLIGDLENITVYSMGWWQASGQPYLAFGDGNGNVYSTRLPKGRDPRDTGSGYRWATRDVVVRFPTLRGSHPERPVTLNAVTLRSRNLSAARTVALSTKAATASSWDSQFTAVESTTQDYSLTTYPHAAGVDVRLTIVTDSNSTRWQVDELLLLYQHPIRAYTRLLEVTLLVKDLVQASDGRVIPKRTRDWLTDLNALVQQEQPVYVSIPAKAVQPYMVRAMSETFLLDDPVNGPSEAVSLVLAGAS